jgi:hypothetical protein
MFGVVLGKTEVELGMKVLGRIYSDLQSSFSYVSAELADTFIDFGRILRLIDITKKVLAVLFETHFFVTEEKLTGDL